MLTSQNLQGIFPAIPTPVHPDDTINVEAARALMRYLLRQGIDGILPLGGTGEYGALSRAQRTAHFALGPAREAMLTLDADLQEIAHGEWEGLLASEIHDKDPARLRAWREEPDTVLMPGGESLRQVLERSWRGLAAAAEGLGPEDTLLVVAHDAVNRVLLCKVLGIPLSRLWTFRQAPTTLNLLEGDDVEALEVVRLNDCSHHTPFFGEAKHRAL